MLLFLPQARAAAQAEEAAERAKIAEAEARRVAAQVQSVQTRQLRDAVAWLRTSAKWPKESLPRRGTVLEDVFGRFLKSKSEVKELLTWLLRRRREIMACGVAPR